MVDKGTLAYIFASEEEKKVMETIYRCQDCEWYTDDTAYLTRRATQKAARPGEIWPDAEEFRGLVSVR